MTTQARFTTADLRHSAFLLARGFSLVDVDRSNGRLRFVINCSPEEAEKYFGPDDRVSCRLLFAAWKRLRDLIDEQRTDSVPITNRSQSRHVYR